MKKIWGYGVNFSRNLSFESRTSEIAGATTSSYSVTRYFLQYIYSMFILFYSTLSFDQCN